jgi:hypothetical protein
MKHLMGVTLGLLGMAAMSALAQQPQRGGGGPGMMSGIRLLMQKSVQKELQITAEQTQKIEEAQAKVMESFSGLADITDQNERRQKMQELAREGERSAAKILKRDQMKRFKEISLQLQGARAFSDPEVAKALDLADEAKEKIKAITDEAGRQQRQQFQQGADPQAARKKMEELRKATMDKVVAILSADQKAKWKELTGEPFKGEIQMGFPGGQRGRRNQ